MLNQNDIAHGLTGKKSVYFLEIRKFAEQNTTFTEQGLEVYL